MTTAMTLDNHELTLAGPVGSLEAYIAGVKAVPILSKEEEQQLARNYRLVSLVLGRDVLTTSNRCCSSRTFVALPLLMCKCLKLKGLRDM